MSRYIDADIVQNSINAWKGLYAHDKLTRDYCEGLEKAEAIVARAPTADVVEVVRCKDCKLFQLDRNIAPDLGTCMFVEMVRNMWDYCSRAESKENEQIY